MSYQHPEHYHSQVLIFCPQHGSKGTAECQKDCTTRNCSCRARNKAWAAPRLVLTGSCQSAESCCQMKSLRVHRLKSGGSTVITASLSVEALVCTHVPLVVIPDPHNEFLDTCYVQICPINIGHANHCLDLQGCLLWAELNNAQGAGHSFCQALKLAGHAVKEVAVKAVTGGCHPCCIP